MSGSTRLLLLIYNLILLFLAAVLIAAALGEANPQYYLEVALSSSQNRFIVGLGGVILCLLALMGIVKSMFGSSKKTVTVPIEGSMIGNIGITIPAITVMIMMAVKTVPGVREIKPKVVNSPTGLVIDLHMMINPEYKVPTMSMDIQNAVKEHLEEIGGLKIATVRVLVDDFMAPDKLSRA